MNQDEEEQRFVPEDLLIQSLLKSYRDAARTERDKDIREFMRDHIESHEEGTTDVKKKRAKN